MKNLFILLPLLVLLFIGCKKEDIVKDNTGAIVKKDYIWEKPLTENQWIWSGPIHVPIFQEKFITATHFEANAKLAALNVFTGETEWEWDDYVGKDIEGIFLRLRWPYYDENILVFQKGPRSYCIDMATGETVWKMEAEQPFHNYLTGTGQEFLSRGTEGVDTMGYKVEYDFIGDIYTGEKYPVEPPEFEIIENTGNIGLRSTGGRLFETDGKKYLLSTYAKFAEHWIALPFLALYNRTDDKWEYTEKQILPMHLRNYASNFPIISDDIIVTSIGYHICANDLWTGDSIWAYDCGGNFSYGIAPK